ncbi:hypothetical protein OUZ56_023122 [Daphnia magna]|uniref:Uncharacterized protein n=1 Tax=Daphnia magna TaxID=35525 RepID=A0ABR0AYD0_9CRUS|nr:hypothetical protein OUZ56_023122 [Daphnia magna]
MPDHIQTFPPGGETLNFSNSIQQPTRLFPRPLSCSFNDPMILAQLVQTPAVGIAASLCSYKKSKDKEPMLREEGRKR